MLGNLLAIPFQEICHHFLCAREIPKNVTTAPPFAIDPRKYSEHMSGIDMTMDMVRDQRMSGIFTSMWGNASGMI
jgi:hypothetical protein